MPLNKMGEFTFKHSAQQDDLYSSMTAAEIKQAFDSRGEELKTTLNTLVDALKAQTAGDSGAQNIGIEPITGVTGTNVQDALEDLRLDINAAVAGTIPDGSITKDKLAFEIATDAQSVVIADANNRFTATNVEGALEELFTSANSLKTNVSGAIGSPATASDTGATLAGYITAEKGRIASNVGDGSSADALKYLVDRLATRLDDLASNVNAKGVVATSADTLAQLVTKVNQIPTGKRTATGSITSGSTVSPNLKAFSSTTGMTGVTAYPIIVSGLSFNPKSIYVYRSTDMRLDSAGSIELPKTSSPYWGCSVGSSNIVALDTVIASDRAYIKDNTFQLFALQANTNYIWFAIE